MIVRRQAPHPLLGGVVRHYQGRSAEPAEPARRVALPARTDVLLEFYFTAPHLIELQSTRTTERAPRVAAVGPQTFRRVDLILSGRMDIFTIHFTPTGLHALLGVPMTELTDAGLDAAALVGGRAIEDLYDRLAFAPDLAARARIADGFILARLDGRVPSIARDPVGRALSRLTAAEPGGPIAKEMGLSDRQFRRVFAQQVGMAPKRYARIARFEAALALRAASPGASWTDVAHACGWFDQAHMGKDFLAFAGAPPSRYGAAVPPR